jgi:hypothetical protein
VPAGGLLTGRPALAVAPDGAVTAVARGRDDGLHVARAASGAAWWGPWSPLGGPTASDPELVVVATGAVWVIATGPDGSATVVTVPARVRGTRRSTRRTAP